MHKSLFRKPASLAFAGADLIYLFCTFHRYWRAEENSERLYFSHLFFLGVLAAGLVFAFLKRKQIYQNIRLFFLSPEPAVNLAVFRVVICATVFFSVNFKQLSDLTALSPQLLVAPPGLSWSVPYLVESFPFFNTGIRLLQLTALLGVLGIFARPSIAAMSLLAVWIFGLPNFYGKVFHEHQCLIWFGLILAGSACADALSLDKLWRKGERKAPHVKYGLPIKASWLVFGMIYFFPGFWKAYYVGLDWIFGDHLLLRMYRQWFFLGDGKYPFFRIDLHPALFTASAAAVLVFELTFCIFLFGRRTRNIFAAGGFLFHAVNAAYILYPFYQLRACYAVFVNWGAILHPNGAAQPASANELCAQKSCIAACSLVLAATFAAGSLNFISWPFSAYPHFADRYERLIEFPRLVALDKQGNQIDIRPAVREISSAINYVRWINRCEKRLLSPDNKVVAEELAGIWSELKKRGGNFSQIARLQVFSMTFSTLPTANPENRAIPLAQIFRYEIRVN